VAPIDGLGLAECGLVGHSKGGAIAVHVAAVRPAVVDPHGIRAAHLGITRLVDPRALHREGGSLAHGTTPPVRSLLGRLKMPRWYLQGALSDPEPNLESDLAAMGVSWKVVPRTGYQMGPQNPEGLARAVADSVSRAWPG